MQMSAANEGEAFDRQRQKKNSTWIEYVYSLKEANKFRHLESQELKTSEDLPRQLSSPCEV